MRKVYKQIVITSSVTTSDPTTSTTGVAGCARRLPASIKSRIKAVVLLTKQLISSLTTMRRSLTALYLSLFPQELFHGGFQILLGVHRFIAATYCSDWHRPAAKAMFFFDAKFCVQNYVSPSIKKKPQIRYLIL